MELQWYQFFSKLRSSMLMPSCYHTFEAFDASRYLYVLICIISLIKLLLRFHRPCQCPQKRNTKRNPILPLKSKGIIPVFELIRVSNIDLYNQWCAECMLKAVKWLYAAQINHSFSWDFFDAMRLYMVKTFVISLGFFTIGVWPTVRKYLWRSASTTVRFQQFPIFKVLMSNGRLL